MPLLLALRDLPRFNTDASGMAATGWGELTVEPSTITASTHSATAQQPELKLNVMAEVLACTCVDEVSQPGHNSWLLEPGAQFPGQAHSLNLFLRCSVSSCELL